MNLPPLYAIQRHDGTFYAGYDPASGPLTVTNAGSAKLYTNKNNVKLRPTEYLVELTIPIQLARITVSQPFRPKRR